MTKITKVFQERALFYPEYVVSERAQMSQYLNMLRKEIREFMSAQKCDMLVELHSSARRRKIELEVQWEEVRSTSVLSQPPAKWFKSANLGVGSVDQGSPRCSRCGNYYDGRY